MAQTADVWVSVPGLKPRTKTHYLRQEKLWGNDDPLFPATKIVVGPAHHFQATGLKPEHWRTAAPIRAIFRKSFTAAGLRYFNPHSVRNTLVSLGEAQCQTPEQFKAWSQNLGHKGVLTTFTSYGAVGNNRQREIIGNLGKRPHSQQPTAEEIAKASRASRRFRMSAHVADRPVESAAVRIHP